jgi:hypothetical protein
MSGQEQQPAEGRGFRFIGVAPHDPVLDPKLEALEAEVEREIEERQRARVAELGEG